MIIQSWLAPPKENLQLRPCPKGCCDGSPRECHPAAIFDLNETPDLMEDQENGGLPDLNVVPAVMVEAQGNGRVPDLNKLPEPEDNQV